MTTMMIGRETGHGKITGRCVPVHSLGLARKESMFDLLGEYFDNITWRSFESDLSEKQWVILLEESAGGPIRGFSTLQLMDDIVVDRVRIRALFSGDTIVDRSCRNSSELFRTFLSFSARLGRQARRDRCRLVWFLISMGYRTYRILPHFFREYYPRFDKDTPAFEKKIIDRLAMKKFPDAYLPPSGIIHYAEKREFLRPGLSEVPPERMDDPVVRYFCDRNPRYGEGDELACIAEITGSNFRAPAFRIMRGSFAASDPHDWQG